jgi:hypothetical protein
VAAPNGITRYPCRHAENRFEFEFTTAIPSSVVEHAFSVKTSPIFLPQS